MPPTAKDVAMLERSLARRDKIVRDEAFVRAAKLLADQDLPMFQQTTIDGAIKSRAWLRNAILGLTRTG